MKTATERSDRGKLLIFVNVLISAVAYIDALNRDDRCAPAHRRRSFHQPDYPVSG